MILGAWSISNGILHSSRHSFFHSLKTEKTEMGGTFLTAADT